MKNILMMTVAFSMLTATPSFADADRGEPTRLLPIKLVCPIQPGNGTLILTQLARDGVQSQGTITYKNNVPVFWSLASAKTRSDNLKVFETYNFITGESPIKNPSWLEYQKNIIQGHTPLKKLCEGGTDVIFSAQHFANKNAFLTLLAVNRKKLGLK